MHRQDSKPELNIWYEQCSNNNKGWQTSGRIQLISKNIPNEIPWRDHDLPNGVSNVKVQSLDRCRKTPDTSLTKCSWVVYPCSVSLSYYTSLPAHSSWGVWGEGGKEHLKGENGASLTSVSQPVNKSVGQ